MLYLSSISTIDIRFECLKFFDTLHKYNNLFTENIEEYFFPYITHSIFPLSTPTCKENKSKSDSFLDITLSKEKEGDNSFEYNLDDNRIENLNLSKDLDLLTVKKKEQLKSQNFMVDEFWTNIKKDNLIKTLNLPYQYIKFYSNKINDSFVDNIYEYLLKWMIGRYDDEKLLIDDSDEIKCENTLNIILKVVMYSKNNIKQKCLQDLFMMCVYNKSK